MLKDQLSGLIQLSYESKHVTSAFSPVAWTPIWVWSWEIHRTLEYTKEQIRGYPQLSEEPLWFRRWRITFFHQLWLSILPAVAKLGNVSKWWIKRAKPRSISWNTTCRRQWASPRCPIRACDELQLRHFYNHPEPPWPIHNHCSVSPSVPILLTNIMSVCRCACS